MDPFEQVWESSRTNAFSWGYPVVLYTGVGVLIALSVIRNEVFRRFLKAIAIFGLAIIATQWSSSEIEEKWRIRREWADAHPAEMTEDGYMGLTVDGANRAMGPLIYGFQAFLLFCIVAVALFVIRAMMFRRPVDPPLEATSEDEINVATDLPTSDNPYHPPADPS
jgi:hypothetical protein